MQTHRIGATAQKACSVRALITGLGLAIGSTTAWAQSPSTPTGAADGAPSEALRRQAASPYRFILQNANAPARSVKPAVASAPEPRRPATPAPVEQAAVQPRSPAVVAPAAPAPAALPQPEPVAALAPRSAEPAPITAVRREIVPIRTDDPRLPPALMRERPSGVVKVQFEVNPDGSTGNVKVLSTTNRSLNRPSVDAVSGWKFQPVDEVLTVETELAYKYD